MKDLHKIFNPDNSDEKKDDKENAPVLCKPYLVTIKAIYHEHCIHPDNIIFRLATDGMGNVIKKPWSPHGSNSDSRLDSLVFGYALHHIKDSIHGNWVLALDALELVQGEDNDPYDFEIIYPVGPNFMAKTIEIDWVAMAATVQQMESSPRKKDWKMVVYEIMEKNLLNDTEYLIGLPTCDISARKV
jgi:hypothetical protein